MEPAPELAEMARLRALLENLPEAASIDTGSARAFAAAARSSLQLGRADDAVALGRAALTLEPGNARAWSVVGDALWAQGQVHEARAAYQTALNFDDKDLATALSCARAQLADGDAPAARALLSFVLLKSHSDELTQLAAELLDALP